MENLSLAHDIYQQTVADTQGQSFNQVAEQLEQKAAKLQSATSQEKQQGVTDTLDELRGENREGIDGVLDETNTSFDQRKVAEDVAQHLKAGAKDLRAALNGKDMENTEHDGDTLAQAGLGEKGSQTGDAAKMQGTEAVVDKDVAKGAVVHEFEHTQQAIQTVDRIATGAQPVEDAPVSNTLDDAPTSGEVTSTQLTEAGAIIEQKRAAPKSFDSLTRVYKQTYEHVLSHVGNEDRIVKLARRADGLKQLQNEAMAV
ncbi:hypothetical protein EXS70_02655 [Candidatus Peribacteria bacterium]|nr:hypothetical protein [Candidatus Peribacteria bacterium]